MDIGKFIIDDRDAKEALPLLTHRMLISWLASGIAAGAVPRENIEHLIRDSAVEMSKGAPSLADTLNFMAEFSIGLLPPDPNR